MFQRHSLSKESKVSPVTKVAEEELEEQAETKTREKREKRKSSTCTIAKLGARKSPDLRDLVYRCESASFCALDEGDDRLGRRIPSHD